MRFGLPLTRPGAEVRSASVLPCNYIAGGLALVTCAHVHLRVDFTSVLKNWGQRRKRLRLT